MWSWYQDHSQCSAMPEKYLFHFKTRSQRSWNRWSDRASLIQNSQENASPGMWRRKKSEELRLSVELKVHINGLVMDEDYPIPDMEMICYKLHGASYFGKIDLSDAYYQIELDEKAKQICKINTPQKLFKMCQLPQELRNPSSIFQNCIESTLKGINGAMIFQDDVLVNRTTNEQFYKRLLALKSRLVEKNFTINKKKSNSRPVDSVNFLGYSISKEGIATDP